LRIAAIVLRPYLPLARTDRRRAGSVGADASAAASKGESDGRGGRHEYDARDNALRLIEREAFGRINAGAYRAAEDLAERFLNVFFRI
jgi:hypothetical protein